jgi:tetratricopeptide (TPR) repeat protein/SAM-dependent methyltransferase
VRPAQNSPEERFAAAVKLHQQGRLGEAEAAYRDLLAADPQHAGALHYFGVLQLQLGRAEAAADLIQRSLARHERNAEAHYHLGLAFAQLGQFADVVAHSRRALELEPGYIDAHLNLGNGLKALGRPADAKAAYERAIELAPHSPQAHFNLANTLAELAHTDEAIGEFERTLALQPAYPEALNNLAGALLARGRIEPALQRYRQALGLRPDFSEAIVGSALAHLMQDDAFTAMVLLCKTLATKPSRAAKDLFVSCARQLTTYPDVPELRDVLTAAIGEPWSRPRFFARLAGAVLKNRGAVADAFANLQHGSALPPETLCSLAADSLLRSLLETTPVADLQLEALLTAARRGILALCADDGPLPQEADALLSFACSLARQCFINEYVFNVDAAEDAEVCTQRQRLADICVAGAVPPAMLVATVACYGPLTLQPAYQRLLERPSSAALEAVLTQQVREPDAERLMAAAIPQWTSIDDTTSLAVRQQYEENPYPRWIKTIPAGRPVSFDAYLSEILPSARLDPTDRAPLDVLVAGCGTGQQPIDFSLRVASGRIVAVDLSRASLGYAARKSAELGLRNIEYAQADILRLGELGRQFDLIQASGVLHHMADPLAAWRGLLDLLRPGGLMLLGFYSERARAEISAARAFIAEKGFAADAAGIRRARAAIAALPDKHPIRFSLLLPDFFSTSECRDLLFHVAEQCLTLPQIARFIRETGLEFLGFQLPRDTTSKYAAANPDDPAMTDLDRWHAFEQARPHTFLGMYQFWVRRGEGGDAG